MRSTRLQLGLLLFALPCCATRPLPSLQSGAVDQAFEDTAMADPPGMDAAPPSPFVLMPGDVLQYRTISADPVEQPRVPVDETGRMEIPLAGQVPVQGLTLSAAARRIEDKVHVLDHHARVLLSIVEASGHRASVLGAVDKAGVYPLAAGARLSDLIALAGGPKMGTLDAESTDFADLEAARVVRGGQSLPVSLARALEGAPRHNIVVAPGDLVYVPPMRGAAIPVLGEVKNARTVAYRPGLRLTEALARAGGAMPSADNADVRVIRGPLSHPRVYTADLAALVDGRKPDVELRRGDVVYVTKHWFATVGDVMQRLTPALAAAALGATVR